MPQITQPSRRAKCCLGPPPPRWVPRWRLQDPTGLTCGCGPGSWWTGAKMGQAGLPDPGIPPAGPEGLCSPFETDPRSGGGSGLHPEWLRELVPRKAEAAQTPARWAASQTPSPTTLAVPRACSCSPHLGSPLTPAYARLRPTAPDVQMPHPKAHVVQEDQGSPSPSASAAPDFILQFRKPRVSETGSRWFCAHLPADRRQGQRLPLLPPRSSRPPTVS